MKTLTRKEILGAPDVQVVPVEVPEWGGCVYIRSMTGAERGRLEKRIHEEGMVLEDARQRLAAASICDEKGKLLFAETDIKKLGERSWQALDRVYNEVLKLNKLTQDDVDELQKN